MTVEIFKSTLYERDLETIWLHVAIDNPEAADRILLAMERTISRLVDFPGSGLSCPHLAPDLRRVLWREYAIYYRWRGETVELARVLHGRRRITPTHFQY